jgi:hypothetical protein
VGRVPPDARAGRSAGGAGREGPDPGRGATALTGPSASVATLATGAVDLRRAPLPSLRAIDFRAEDRDLWADEAALWDRFRVSWAGLDDLAWAVAGAAPSDAGGADWSLGEHVGHVVDWQEMAVGYVATAARTGRWPTDAEFDGGDWDQYNERRRARWSTLPAVTIRQRLESSHAELVTAVRDLPLGTIRSDAAWGWLFFVLHGHQLDHLEVLEPWAELLRRRQIDGDPFGADPYRSLEDAGDREGFFAADAAAFDAFATLIDAVPLARWTAAELTPGWDLKDHVGHVAAWLEEAVAALDDWRATGRWRAFSEGEDAWNAREAERWRPLDAGAVRRRLGAAHDAVVARARSLPADILTSYDGIGWTYDVLHGHLRKHLALVAPWASRAGWPPA